MEPETLRKRLGDYQWWQTIDLGGGVKTPGVASVGLVNDKVLEVLRDVPIAGKRVLEIGCRDGLFSFEAERLGAREVTGIDHMLSRGAVELLVPALNSKLKMVELNLFDLSPERFGKFDVIIFAGVLYHLRYPFWALRIIRDMLAEGGVLILETACFRSSDRSPMLYCPVGEESPYEPTSVTFFNERGLCDSLTSMGFVVETFRFAAEPPAPSPTALLKKGIMSAALGVTRIASGLGVQSPFLEKQLGEKIAARLDRKEILRGIVRCKRVTAAQDADISVYWEGVPTKAVEFRGK